MGERKGTNKYYPPDFDPQKHRNLAGYTGQHPLRERARKLHMGILIIRFEMPYNIWCEGCNNPIGMGVRYNAEKSKVGMYYTTPIYKFRMKCHLCNNHFEIKTDPANHDYVIISGARRKEQRWDPKDNEQIVTDDKEDIKKLASDPMYKLEHGIDDKQKIKTAIPTIYQLAQLQDSKRDDYLLNKLARSKFRGEKKQIQSIKNEDAALLAKSSLDIPLVEETEDDQRMAQMLKYQTVASYDEKKKKMRDDIMSQSIFSSQDKGQSSNQATPSSNSSSASSNSGSSKKQQVAVMCRQLNKAGAKQNSFGKSKTDADTAASSQDKLQQLGIVRKTPKSTCTDNKPVRTTEQDKVNNQVHTQTDTDQKWESETLVAKQQNNSESPDTENPSNSENEADTETAEIQTDNCTTTVTYCDSSKICNRTGNLEPKDVAVVTGISQSCEESSLKALAGMYNTSSGSDSDT